MISVGQPDDRFVQVKSFASSFIETSNSEVKNLGVCLFLIAFGLNISTHQAVLAVVHPVHAVVELGAEPGGRGEGGHQGQPYRRRQDQQEVGQRCEDTRHPSPSDLETSKLWVWRLWKVRSIFKTRQWTCSDLETSNL